MQLFNDDDEADYYDLGRYKRRILTTCEEAQTWFDRGLIWTYGFNHEAAVGCFEKAILHDKKCAMAWWGLAYALGPNYNKPWEVYDKVDLEKTLKRTHEAAAKARKYATDPIEQALADAIQYRYLQNHSSEAPMEWNKLYANAMSSAYKKHGDDLEVATFYADSLMNITPWKMWDIHTGKPNPEARTMEAKAVLEKVFQQPGGLEHPGSLHLYIHLMEMSPTPEVALPIADRLRGICPDAGHLQHMPSHIDVLCGDWRRAISSNTDAMIADNKFAKRDGVVNFYTLYRCHDMHFRLYAAMFAGQSELALQTAQDLVKAVPEELLRVESPPMADWLEGFASMHTHALIRFGKWQDIINLQFPKDQELYCYTTAIFWYAKGIAYSATSQIANAESARSQFRDAVRKVKPSRTVFNNSSHDILKIASAMLDGELRYRKRNYELAFKNLRRAVELDDALPYDEPPGWIIPARHALGALLLEQGHVEEAMQAYKADLGLDDTLPRPSQHPNNVWALHGYHECLRRLGRHDEAKIIKKQLDIGMATADVRIGASCACSRSANAD